MVLSRRLTKAVDGLLTDERLLARFRRKPAQAMAQYHLTREQLAMVETGDLRTLLDAGLDRRVAFRKPVSRLLFGSMLFRFGARLAPAAFLALVLLAMPGSGARAEDVSRRARTG